MVRRSRRSDHTFGLGREFTPDEANALLPTVRPVVERLVAAKHAFDAAQERSDELSQHISGNGGGIPPAELAELRGRIEQRASEIAAVIGELEELGLLVKDIDSGLVDFPSTRDGEPVLLCWLLGEDEVAWYHGYDDGFAGRQPL